MSKRSQNGTTEYISKELRAQQPGRSPNIKSQIPNVRIQAPEPQPTTAMTPRGPSTPTPKPRPQKKRELTPQEKAYVSKMQYLNRVLRQQYRTRHDWISQPKLMQRITTTMIKDPATKDLVYRYAGSRERFMSLAPQQQDKIVNVIAEDVQKRAQADPNTLYQNSDSIINMQQAMQQLIIQQQNDLAQAEIIAQDNQQKAQQEQEDQQQKQQQQEEQEAAEENDSENEETAEIEAANNGQNPMSTPRFEPKPGLHHSEKEQHEHGGALHGLKHREINKHREYLGKELLDNLLDDKNILEEVAKDFMKFIPGRGG